MYKNKFKFLKLFIFKDLYVRPETMKLLEENKGSALFDIGRSNIFLDMSPQARETKAKQTKWTTSN